MEKQYQTKYPSDVSDEEWAFVAPYLTLCREDAPQREHALRAVFNGLRYIVRTDNQWRFMPGDLPPWAVVYQQTQRWMRAGVFEILVEDVRSLLREFAGRKPQPTAMIVDSRTLQSTPEAGARAGYDGAKRRKSSKVHAAVDTLGHLLALHVTAASEQDRAQVERLAEEVQQITGRSVQLAYVDQGYTGQTAADAAAQHGIQLQVVKHTEQSAASSCCPEDGSSSEASPGPLVSADSPETTNDSDTPSPVTTTSPSLGSCSPSSQNHSTKVHNGL
jgi:transposase